MFQWFGLTSEKIERYDTPTIETWTKQQEKYVFTKELNPIRVDDVFYLRFRIFVKSSVPVAFLFMSSTLRMARSGRR